MKREKSVTKANVDLIVGNCLANQALEGLVCTPEDEAACRRIVTGETTLDQELAPILAKYLDQIEHLQNQSTWEFLKGVFRKKRKD